MQNNSKKEGAYFRALNRNIVNNLAAGIVIVVIAIIIHLLGGCEQPELHHKTPLIDTLRTEEGNINEWNIDTTVYHSAAIPN